MSTHSRFPVTPTIASRRPARVLGAPGNEPITVGLVGGPRYPRQFPARTVSGAIDHFPVTIPSWVASAYGDSGVEQLLGFVRGTGTSFTIDVSSAPRSIQSAFVVVRPDAGVGWRSLESVALNALRVAVDPTGTPYLFKCTTAGITGTSEPAWATTTPGSSTTSDGSVVWTCISRLVRPIADGPRPIVG